MDNLTLTWAAIYAVDIIVVCLFIGSFFMSADNIYKEKYTTHLRYNDVRHLPLTYLAWFVYALVLDVKVVVIFTTFSTDLDENVFFGPNTLKTSLAIAGLVFLTFIATQHDLKTGQRRNQLVSLTAAVVFDHLDSVDILDNLFDKEARTEFPAGLATTIIVICCLNLLLPTLPMFTLVKTRFGLRRLPEKYELMHKFAIGYLVNLPLFVTRMITWHGLSSGISIFLLKNVMAIGVVTFEICEHFCNHDNKHKDEEMKHVQNVVPDTSV